MEPAVTGLRNSGPLSS